MNGSEALTINLSGLNGNGHVLDLVGPDGISLANREDVPGGMMRERTSARATLSREIAQGGVSYLSGYVESDEFNAKLEGQDGVLQYDKMRRTDAQLQAILFAAKLPVKGAKWDIRWPEGKTGSARQLKFAKDNLFQRISFPQFLEHALSCLWAGFSWFEKVYVYEDGKLQLRKLAPRLASTVDRWWTDSHENLIGIRQEVDATGFRADMPLDKIVLFSFQMEGNNYEGMSLLRGAYKHWFIKDQIYHIDAIRIERFALGVPHFKVPSENFDTKTISDLITVGKNWKAGEQSYLITPQEIEVELLSLAQAQVLDVLSTIQHHNEEIGKSTLTQFINLGTTQSGSRALGETNVEFFYDSVKAVANWLAEEITRQVLWPLMDLNFPGHPRPVLTVEDIGAVGLQTIKDMLRDVGDTYIQPDLDTENHIRKLLHLPARTQQQVDEDEEKDLERQEKEAEIQSKRFQRGGAAQGGREAGSPSQNRPPSRPVAASQLDMFDEQFTWDAAKWRTVLEETA